MITIKIKTWKDYKAQFLEWVKAPRQNECIDYVNFMRDVVEKNNYNATEAFAKKHSLTQAQQEELENLINDGLRSGLHDTIQLIRDCQPKHLL